MKRSLKLFAILLVSLLVFTGCGKDESTKKQSNEEALENVKTAIKNTLGDRNLSFKLTYDVTEKEDNDSMKIDVVMDGNIYTKDNKEYFSYKSTNKIEEIIDGKKDTEESTAEGYEVYKEGNYYFYEMTSDDNKWTYVVDANGFLEELTAEFLSGQIKSVENVPTDRKDNFYLYTVELSKSFYSDFLGIDSDEAFTTVQVRNNKIEKVIIRVTPDTRPGVTKSEEIEFILEISNVGEVKEITVPEDVLEVATEETYDDIFEDEE